MPTNSLAEVARSNLAAYYDHLGRRVVRLTRMLDENQLWTNPFPFGNSVGRLVVHLTGNLNHYVGAKIAGTGYERDRPAEFQDPTRVPLLELIDAFERAIRLVVESLGHQNEADFLTSVDDCGPPVTDRFGLFLVCLAHLNNHIGQIVYLVQAHGHSLDEKVW